MAITSEQLITELYIAYFNRAPDPLGLSLWVTNFNAGLPITTIAQDFSNSSEAQALYPFLALPVLPLLPIAQNFVTTVYVNLLNRPVDAAGLAFWSGLLSAGTISPSNFVLDVLQSINMQVGTADAILLANKVAVADFYTELASTDSIPFSSVLAHLALQGVNGTQASVTAQEAFIAANIHDSFTTFTLTPGQDHFAGTGGDTFNAPLAGVFGFANQNTLTAGDSLTDTGPGSVLNATFFQTDHNQTIRSLNIVNIPIWNIDMAGTGDGTVTLTGDGLGGPNQISGLRVLNVTFDEGTGCLIVGDNSSPIQEPNGADGFTINVSDATGDGVFYNSSGSGGSESGSGSINFNSPCVDVDIAAAAFTGHDTINVTANIVGGFPQYNGSYIIPTPILDRGGDRDDYDPNWLGYLADAFSISAGASAGNLVAALGPLGGAVGFANWVVASTGAMSVGTLNIIALGGEGSMSAQTITLTDDGSNTMLFATAVSDALSTDWTNVKTVTLTGTKGFVTLTGLETNVQEVSGGFLDNSSNPLTAANFASAFQRYDGGGLLASDTAALTSIAGGAGNSFYDLSSLTPAAAHAGTWDGGHSTAGNSEIAFNNLAITTAGTITLTNIQILDDVSSIGSITVPDLNPDGTLGTAILENGGEAQGGIINMNNFAGLAPLNVAYALLAEGLPSSDYTVTVGGPVPSGLPFTTLPAGITAASSLATDLQAGVVPAGFELLQLLNAEGSTQTVLGAKLVIENGPVNFAINMQDTADGTLTIPGFVTLTGLETNVETGAPTWTGFDITITEGQPPSPTSPTIVNFANTLVLFVSDDGVNLSNKVDPGTAMYVPELTIDNYSTVNIVLPTESVPGAQNYVILGGQDPLASSGGLLNGPGFIDTPVVTVQNAVVNFYDNSADNGGSPPGGEDNLVLGFTNFTGTLTTAYIGVPTVSIDTVPLDFTTTINDFGTGSFEIGATNVTNLNAQSTAGLIMDLPGTNTAAGINVNGSLLVQNLEQGTSGLVVPDFNGHAATDGDGCTDEVYEALFQTAGVGWGNDTLTGGDGFGSVTFTNVGGAISETFTFGVSNANIDGGVSDGPGNTGDNFFPEGGNDVVNIAAGEVGTLTSFQDVISSSGSILVASTHAFDNESTVWVGFYDTCNSAGPDAGADNLGAPNTGVGTVWYQAITDIVGGVETFVDGYGATGKAANDPTTTTSTPVVTINGFHFGTGNTVGVNAGDTVVFGAADWAVTPTGATPAVVVDGLVESDGHTTMPAGFATYADVGTGGAFATTTGAVGGAAVKVVEDSIGGSYTSAAALQNALSNHSTSFFLAGPGVTAGHEADILVAYQLAPGASDPTGAIVIADVTLTNDPVAASTDVALLNPVVHNLVQINTTTGFVGVANLFAHNIDFFASPVCGVGAPGTNSTFTTTYSDGGVGGGNTFQIGDVFTGGPGGINTLIITPTLAIGAGDAATSLGGSGGTSADIIWAGVSGIQNVDIITHAGAINLDTGAFFEAAFSTLGINLTTTSGAGAQTIDMSGTAHFLAGPGTTFTGDATITANTGAGAINIATGTGPLTHVFATTTGAGAQTIFGTDSTVDVTASAFSGAQTITLGNGNDAVTASSGLGTQTITLGNGNDVVDLSGSNAAASAVIKVGTGLDTITLSSGHTGADTLTFSAANGANLSNFTTVTNAHAADTITWATGALNATINTESGLHTAATGVAAANLSDGYNIFTDGTNTYIYEYTGSAATSELVALVGVHTLSGSTTALVAAIA